MMTFTSYLTSSHYFFIYKREIVFPWQNVVKDLVTIKGPGTHEVLGAGVAGPVNEPLGKLYHPNVPQHPVLGRLQKVLVPALVSSCC